MKVESKLILSSFLILGLAACSGGSGGSGGGLKNYGQSSAKLEEVARSFNRVQRVASEVKKNDHSRSSSADRANADQSMRSALQDCSIQMKEPRGDQNGFSFEFAILKPCPVTAKYSMDLSIGQDRVSSKYSVEMNINDSQLAQENDVYAAKISGGINGQANGNGGSLTGQTSGTISSKKYGEVKVQGSFEGKGNEAAARLVSTLTFTIQDEVTEYVEITDARNGDQATTYKINGKDVSKEKYQEAVRKLGFLGQGVSLNMDPSAAPDDNNNSSGNEDSEVPSQPQPLPNMPAPVATPTPAPTVVPAPVPSVPSGKEELACRAKLVNDKTYWKSQEIVQACAGTSVSCVYDVIKKKPYGEAADVAKLCQTAVADCSVKVIPLKPYWDETEIVTACKKADADCVAEMIKKRPYDSAADINGYCSL